jgi:hypothetical protein
MAISFDTVSGQAGGSGRSSLSWSHTNSGNILYVGGFLDGGSTSEFITGINFNGTPMDQAQKLQRSLSAPNWFAWAYLYVLKNAPIGTYTVEITASSSIYIDGGMAVSYFDADIVSQPDNASANRAEIATTVTNSITTIADNCWTVCYGYADNGSVAAGTGLTSRATQSNVFIIGDSNGPTTPAGSVSMTINGAANSNLGILMSSFDPSTGPTETIVGSSTPSASFAKKYTAFAY